MHLTTDTIADYTEALKDAQRKAKRSNNPVSDEYLVMVATKAMMGNQQFPRSDDDWEDIKPLDRDWKRRQKIYLKADSRELLRRQAMGEGEKFGGAATQGLAFLSDGGREPPAGRPTPETMEDVEGCFNGLAGVVATESATLAELVKTNAMLTTTNSTLTVTILKLTKVVNDLTEVKKGCGGGGGGGGGGGSGGGGRGDAKHCPNCKRDTWHKPNDCFEMARNKDKRPSYWKLCL